MKAVTADKSVRAARTTYFLVLESAETSIHENSGCKCSSTTSTSIFVNRTRQAKLTLTRYAFYMRLFITITSSVYFHFDFRDLYVSTYKRPMKSREMRLGLESNRGKKLRVLVSGPILLLQLLVTGYLKIGGQLPQTPRMMRKHVLRMSGPTLLQLLVTGHLKRGGQLPLMPQLRRNHVIRVSGPIVLQLLVTLKHGGKILQMPQMRRNPLLRPQLGPLFS